MGMVWGVRLAVLPPLVVLTIRATQPGDGIVLRILGAETLLIAAVQVAISIAAARKAPTFARALTPALLAGLIVSVADVASFSFAFQAPAAPELLTFFAYDVGLGAVLALPVVVVRRAAACCRRAAPKEQVDATPETLLGAYRKVLKESTPGPARWRSCVLLPHRLIRRICMLLTHQLIRRHIRRTLEAVQRGYAERAVEHGLSETETGDRRMIDDYLLSVPPVSRLVPIPTVATVFVFWKLVPGLVAVATMVAEWFGGDHSRAIGVMSAVDQVLPHEVASLVIDTVALVIAFPLVMLVLAPSIHRRDKLLAKHEVCEREVKLMDDCLHVPRRSRRLEYVMAALPALPFGLYGSAVLAYALAGLFLYPSPKGPLGGFVERADLMHLGPITGAVLALPFLFMAALWTAWIVKARKTTRVVLL